jgi:glycosyltransferase involved in cell wall biosynthesis
MDKPLVSVLMTAYNREKYIAEAIESVIASTYQNWELIIVDDCSKDDTVAIARSYVEKDERINVYINEKNLGDYPNRNQAASYAKGKYLKYVDADDMIYPYGLEQLVYYMEQFPDAGYGLCSQTDYSQQIYPFELSPHEAYKFHYIEKQTVFHRSPLSSIISNQIFRSLGGFTGKRMLGDFELWNILSQKHSVVLMPLGIVWYRKHEEQEMSKYKSDPTFPFQYLLVAKDLILSSECPLNTKEIEKTNREIDIKISKSIISAAKHHSMKVSKHLKKFQGKVTILF